MDNGTKRGSGYVWHWSGIDPAVALQNAEYNYLSCRSTSTIPLAVSAEIRLINLMFATAERGFLFAGDHDAFADHGIHAISGMAIDACFPRGSRSRHLQDEVPNELIQLPIRNLASWDDAPCHRNSVKVCAVLDKLHNLFNESKRFRSDSYRFPRSCRTNFVRRRLCGFER